MVFHVTIGFLGLYRQEIGQGARGKKHGARGKGRGGNGDDGRQKGWERNKGQGTLGRRERGFFLAF